MESLPLQTLKKSRHEQLENFPGKISQLDDTDTP